MIVLNEREWAEEALKTRELGRRPTETLSRVAKYFIQCEKFKKADAKKRLEEFLLQCDPNVVLVKWSETLDRIVKAAMKYPIIIVESVGITKKELSFISEINGRQAKRLAFTLLCVAKYWNVARPDNNGWVNTPDKEIMKMANVGTSIKRQSQMLRDLHESGAVDFSKRVDSLNVRVNYIDDGPIVLAVSDFRNLGNQYMMYCGEPYIRCAQCGLVVKRKSNAQKYCQTCASDAHIKKSVESVMRKRENSLREIA